MVLRLLGMAGLGAVASVATAVPVDPPVERELTSATGETVIARIVEVTDTQVRVVRSGDREVFLFPVERLSAEDRGFVGALMEMAKKQPVATPVESKVEPAPTADTHAQALPLPRPSFSRAMSQLGSERDPDKVRLALETVIQGWPGQSIGTFPVHYVSFSIWRAFRRLPSSAGADSWINGLLAAQLNNADLDETHRDGYAFISLTRETTMIFSPEWRKALAEFTRQRPRSPLLPALVTADAGRMYSEDPDTGKAYLRGKLSDANAAVADAAREKLAEWAELEALGPIQNWRFTAIDGRTVDLSKMRGKVVIVDFWATWCGPCLKELPNLRKLHETYHDRGLEIVGVALEHSRPDAESALKKLRAFVAENQMPWPHYADGGGWNTKLAKAMRVGSIPRVIVIDRRGQVIDRRLRGEELAAEVARLLGDS